MADQYFPAEKIRSEWGRFSFPNQPIINKISSERFYLLRDYLSKLDQNDFGLLTNIIEIFQEIHRFLITMIQFTSNIEFKFNILLDEAAKGFYFLKRSDRITENCKIFLGSNDPPEGFSGLWLRTLDTPIDRIQEDSWFRFDEFHSEFKEVSVQTGRFRYWPQRLNERLAVQMVPTNFSKQLY